MSQFRGRVPRPPRRPFFAATAPWLVMAAAWAGVGTLAIWWMGPDRGTVAALVVLPAFWAAVLAAVRLERRRWMVPLRRLEGQVDALTVHPAAGPSFAGPPEIAGLVRSLSALSDACARLAVARAVPEDGAASGVSSPMTRSGLFQSSVDLLPASADPQASNDFSTTDMVNRLDPRLFRWLESSPAEQAFLGWALTELREKSFLEIVHPDDLARVREKLNTALVKGEVHGLILRIRTAPGRHRAIEMNLGARYGADMKVSHLRSHVTDVTSKVRAERELRLRTRELTQVNEQLRQINRELEELKERYRDLYQNAPAMYFSLDREGKLQECNDTLLRTLGYPREALLGRPYEVLLPPGCRLRFAERFAEFLRVGRIEVPSQWVKADGGRIDVWVCGTAVRDESGRIVHSRSVAQDVTARHRLEAELREKNERLARTIDELSRRNKEMDEFTYVVSHDLQEPLRTLTAFSDFLMRDYGGQLDAEGHEFVRHIAEASRRMRALINDLLSLSRVGKVTAEFSTVKMEDILSDVRADLAELIRSRGAEVRVDGPLPEVWGDRARLGQLLANLIGNGLKYNDQPGPWVEVGARPGAGVASAGIGDDGWVTVWVRDNGIGIDPQFHAKIFKLFRRLHTPEEYEGTGAGLAICTKIAQAHGGRVWVESEPGRGSIFFVSLRRAPAGASQPALPGQVPNAT